MLPDAEINPGIEKILNNVRPQFEDLSYAPPEIRDRMLTELSGRIASESEIILHDFELKLTKACLRRPSFADTWRQNAFWSSSVRQDARNSKFVYSPPVWRMRLPSRRLPFLFAALVLIVLSAGVFLSKKPVLMGAAAPLAAVATFFVVRATQLVRYRNAGVRFVEGSLSSLRDQLRSWLREVESRFESEIQTLENKEM